MKSLKIVVLIAGLILASNGFTWGQSAKTETPLDSRALFDLLDRNQDGKIDRDEYLKVWKDKAAGERAFRQLDRNSDGFLGREEFGLPGLTIMRW